MSPVTDELLELAKKCKDLSEEFRRYGRTNPMSRIDHKKTNVERPVFQFTGNNRDEVNNKRESKIQQIFDKRSLSARGKPSQEDLPEAKRTRRKQPEVIFPILPIENYTDVRPLPTPQRISPATQKISKLNANEAQIKQINKIKLLQVNAHGALTATKLAYLKVLIEIHKPELILVNEFGQPKDTPVFPKIETYHAVSYDLKAAFSGVAIYVQAALLEIVELVQVKHSLGFSQIAGVQIQGTKIYTVYRSPNPLSSLEADDFCQWIRNLDNDKVLIIGDLNLHVDWETYNSSIASHFKIASAFLDKGFVQYQQHPTYQKSGRILDITLCNAMNTVISCGVDKFRNIDKVDHYPTITEIALDCNIVEQKEVKIIKKRDVKKYKELVSDGIEVLLKKHVPDVTDITPSKKLIDNMENDLSRLLLNCEEQTVPKVTIKVNEFKPRSIDTMGKKTKELFRLKSKFLKKGMYARVDEVQKELDASLAQDRANWSQKFVNDLKKDPNYIWKLAKTSTVTASSTGGLQRPDGSLTFDRKEKVQLLSARYGSVLTPKTEPTCDVDSPETCQAPHQERLSDIIFTVGDIFQTLKATNASWAKDSRGLYVPLYRDAREALAPYLTIMFNLMIHLCYLTSALLLAMVLPIPKGGDLTLPKQWRGIVLEQSDLRIFEKGLNFKIVKFLEEIHFFHPSQFGFRWGKSCIHNLVSFWSYLVALMRNYAAVDVIYADTSAAFDRLSHGLLMDKLFHQCGIQGNVWKTIKAWTTNRRQFVRWNGVDSEKIPVTSSCMQGSCLGTTCWNVYFNEILFKIEEWIDELKIEGASVYVYADDVKIVYPAIEENIPKINELLKRLQKLMDDHYLKFNADKCSVLTLGDINPNLPVYMKNDAGQEIPLKRTQVERDLGVLVDSDGSFKSHIKKSLSIAKATVKILSKIFFKTSFDDKKKLYHAYVFSRMSYGSEIWGTNDVLILNEFNKIYEQLFKFTKVDEGQWPPYTPEQLMVEKDLLIMYDIFHHQSPVTKEEIMLDESNSQRDGPQTRSQTQEHVMSQENSRDHRWNRWTNTLLVERNRRRWNSIPVEVRKSPDRLAFKNHIRKEILEKMLCNQIRLDMLSGELRERSLRHKDHLEKSNLRANINWLVGNEANTPIDDLLMDTDFKDDFLQPDLCLKRMKRTNQEKLKQLSQIAPWMLICKCQRPQCKKELQDFEKVHGKKLREHKRVVIVDDKVIFTNSQLTKETKKLSDVFKITEKFEFNC